MNLKQMVRKFPRIANFAKSLRAPLGRSYIAAHHMFPGVKKKRVFFSSFVGKSYNDSPRYICEELLKLRPDIDVVWQLSPNASGRNRLPKGVRTVPHHSLKALRAMATSAVIVDNFNRPFYIPKFPDQYYIQTWHGDRGFKRIRLDRNAPSRPLLREAGYLDLMVSGSRFGSEVYRTACNYKGIMPEVNHCLFRVLAKAV